MWGPAIYEQRISTNPKSCDLCIPLLDCTQKGNIRSCSGHLAAVRQHRPYTSMFNISSWCLLIELCYTKADSTTVTAANALDLVLRNSSTLLQVKLISTQPSKKNLTLWQKYPKGNLMD